MAKVKCPYCEKEVRSVNLLETHVLSKHRDRRAEFFGGKPEPIPEPIPEPKPEPKSEPVLEPNPGEGKKNEPRKSEPDRHAKRQYNWDPLNIFRRRAG